MADLPTIISRPGGESTSLADGILTAAAPTAAYTTVTRSEVVFYTGVDGTSTRTTQVTLTITDTAEYASLATQSAIATTISSTASASASVSATKSSAAASSSAAVKPASSTSILIPAIVAPIAAILVVTFVFFWWFMRRRAKQAAKDEPEFVMEKRNEKFLARDDSSTHSHSSTRNLVAKAESIPVKKEPVPDVREVGTASFDLFPAEGRSSVSRETGTARVASPLQPQWHSRQNSDDSHNPSGPPLVPSVAVRNFSRGPSRPSTASKDGGPGITSFSRDGSLSSPGLRPSTAGNDSWGRTSPVKGISPGTNRPDPRGPLPFANGGSRPSSPASRGGPSPAPRSGPRPPPSAFTSRDRPQYPQSRRPQPAPAHIQTDRQYTPKLNPPTPTGAYNGASPISQYSPIVKDGPGFNTSPIARVLAQTTSRKDPPSAIKTGSKTGSASQSSDFSEENMHIARLADSSRLGFYPTNSTRSPVTAVHSTTSSSPTVDPPNPSPRLPPPATRDAPPSNINIPIPPTPVETATPADSRRANTFAADRRSTRSMVSRLSSDDEYIDDEIDSKSEVSSLDDGERWQMEQDSRSASQLGGGSGSASGSNSANASGMVGYAGFGGPVRPPLLMHDQGKGSPSDAGSSTYSLGRY